VSVAQFERDLAVIGAGHIGLPWAAVMAIEAGVTVTCIDVDETRVAEIERGEAPFEEPELEEYVRRARDRDALRATSDAVAVADHEYVAFTMNAERRRMSQFADAVASYTEYLTDDHVVVNRTTLPVGMITELREVVADTARGSPTFTVFPERLAEGRAITEILTLPKVVGADQERGETALRELLEPLGCEVLVSDPETAMFVKLIDNAYRDAKFSIANQIAFTAEELGLNSRVAIELANHDYERNDIPIPGTVGGKCLPKDPHFLTDERICDQPTTPDLFNRSRRTNASIPRHIANAVLGYQPDRVALLGISYKPGIGDTYNSPAVEIGMTLAEKGVEVAEHDPHVAGTESARAALDDADVVILAVDHDEFEDVESKISEFAPDGSIAYDVWGTLDATRLVQEYDGFGI